MRLSIIMPFYNKEEKIVRLAINSILQQTIDDFELICVNDASPGNSADFLYKMAETDKRLKILTHETNKGVSVARNTALDIAQGDYIGFVDSDDMIVKNYYEVMLRAAEITGADIISSTFRNIKYDDINIPEISFNEKCLQNRPCKKYYAFKARSIWNRIYRKECINNIRFVPELKIFEDLVYLNEAIVNAKTLCDINFDGYLYRSVNPEIMRPRRNVPAPASAPAINVPWFFLQNQIALENILNISLNGDKNSEKAISYIVLRRYFRLALKIRKHSPEQKNVIYAFMRDFLYRKVITKCRKNFPLSCSIAKKIWKKEKYYSSFMLKLQLLRLLIEMRIF